LVDFCGFTCADGAAAANQVAVVFADRCLPIRVSPTRFERAALR
jgi:hypothetical protein